MGNKKMWIHNADCMDGFYENPVLTADYSDPDAIRVGEDYYMIASSFSNAPGLPVLHSKDLVNWEIINYVLPRIPDDRYDKAVHGCGVWAPSIRYHEGIFYACFPMPDEGIYMSTTKDPYGEWSEPVNIRPGAGWIDPCPFWDEDGKAYLVAGVAKSRIGYKSVLHMVEMSPDGMSLFGEEKVIFDGNENDQETIEGPKMYKRNGYYYIFAPAGGVKVGWQTVLRSKNVWGPYEYKIVMKQGASRINGPHQGAWVDTVTGEDWFLHFQDVYALGRITILEPMQFVNDWPVIGVCRDDAECGEPVDRWKKPNIGNVTWEQMEPQTSDTFPGGKMGLCWQWNANPKEYFVRKSESGKDGLLLNAVKNESGVYGDACNLLLQKWPAKEFSCETKISLKNLQSGEQAGVISMGKEYGVIAFAREEDQIKVEHIFGKQIFGKILAERTEEEKTLLETVAFDPEKPVYVKYQVKQTGRQDLSEKEKDFPLETVTVSYWFEGEEEKEAFKMKAVPGRWVGVKNGVFCMKDRVLGEKEQDEIMKNQGETQGNTQGAEDCGYVEVCYVRYETV